MTTTAPLFPLYTSSIPVKISPDGCKTCSKAYQQRAVIRAVVRESLALFGYQGIHMRQLAELCGVSLQTLYNNFGGREEIVASSVAELVRAQLIHARKISALTGQNFMLGCCDQLIQLIRKDWNYVNAVFTAFKKLPRDIPVVVNMKRELLDAYLSQLNLMKKEGNLKPWVNTEKLALTLQNAIDGVILAHWDEKMNIEEFGEQLKLSVGLPLLGAAYGREAELIEASL